MEPIVRIIDDDEEARESTAFLLTMAGWCTQAYESAQSFLDNDEVSVPGCILLDIRMPGMTGMELQLKLREEHVELPIIFLSGHGDMSMAIHAFRRGASDFLEKNVTSEELQEAVKKAVTASMKAFTSNCEKKKLLELYESLTPREKQVCVGVAQGKLNKVIAYELDIAERTVKMHRSHLLEKLEVKSPVELAFLLKSIGALDAE